MNTLMIAKIFGVLFALAVAVLFFMSKELKSKNALIAELSKRPERIETVTTKIEYVTKFRVIKNTTTEIQYLIPFGEEVQENVTAVPVPDTVITFPAPVVINPERKNLFLAGYGTGGVWVGYNRSVLKNIFVGGNTNFKDWFLNLNLLME
jgi:hypothetical protein